MLRSCRRFLAAAAFLVVASFAEPADIIWSARYVVTMDAQRRII